MKNIDEGIFVGSFLLDERDAVNIVDNGKILVDYLVKEQNLLMPVQV